ncbi:MAG: 50S ribosomal protein L22 [Candidatus Micrarchaeaceae archaeon]
MMRYSFNQNTEGIVFAQRYDINASYKDLVAMCDAVRYRKVSDALDVIDKVIAMEMPVPYKRYSKHMGARHELGGRKGAYPVKAAKELRLAILNAVGNAKNRGLDGEGLVIVHSSANKTRIERRYPSKGSISWGRGMYGRGAINHSDIEYAKVEIGIANGDEKGVTKNMKYFIKKNEKKNGKKSRADAGQKAKEKARKPQPAQAGAEKQKTSA